MRRCKDAMAVKTNAHAVEVVIHGVAAGFAGGPDGSGRPGSLNSKPTGVRGGFGSCNKVLRIPRAR